MKKLTKEIILETLHNNRLKIRNFGVKKLTLFGSYAIDEQNENSDIDFLVEFEKGGNLFDEYFGTLHFLEDLFNKKIDLVKPHLVKDELKKYILEGVKYEASV